MKISTHILDLVTGKPASGVSVALEARSGETWHQVSDARTDGDGRVLEFFARETLQPGAYRLVFDTEEYFKQLQREIFYPEVSVTFNATETKYHIPLLLSAFGYQTYRGS